MPALCQFLPTMAEIGEQRTRKDSFEQSSSPSQGRPRKDSFDSTTSGRPQPVERRSSEIEEKSPNERYVRSKDVVFGNSSGILISYKAFDTNNGVEIAWHKFNLITLDLPDKERLKYCMDVVKQLDSDYLIRYLDTWSSEDNNIINIITTNLESLKEFVSKVKTLRWRIVKKWCRQFLAGLSILHTHTPAIIHRHFSFAHIYIDGGLGTTSVGDLWLAAIMAKDSSNNSHQMGLSEAVTKNLTLMAPTYMAPEMFESQPLTTKVDIYCLGMCVLEMLSGEEPYKECGGSQTKLRSKVLAGLPPLALQRVPYHAAKDFIAECLLPVSERPSAAELVKHEFLLPSIEDDDEIVLAPGKVSDYTAHREAVSVVANTVTAIEPSAVPPHPHVVEQLKLAVEQPLQPVANLQILPVTEIEERRILLPSPTAPTAPAVQATSLFSASSPTASSLPTTAPASPSASIGPPTTTVQQSLLQAGTPHTYVVDASDVDSSPVMEAVQLMNLQKSSVEGTSDLYQLQINIPAGLFLDGSVRVDKEVEFSFDCGTDSFLVVSAEMIEELGLRVSVDALASQIEAMVRHASTEESPAPQQAQIATPLPTIMSGSVQESTVPPAAMSSDSCVVPDIICVAQVEVLQLPAGALTVDVPDRTASATDMTSTSVYVCTTTATPTEPLTTAESDVSPACAVPQSVECDSQPSTSTGCSPLITSTPTAESATHIAITNVSSADGVSSSAEPVAATSVQLLASSPTAEEQEEHPALRGGGGVLLQQELERIDQEARVARRAFENRIQKLITIQEKCQEDIVKLETAHDQKSVELSRKEDKARTQRDVEIAKAEAATRQKLEALRQSFLSRHTTTTPVATTDAATTSSALPGNISECGLDHQQ